MSRAAAITPSKKSCLYCGNNQVSHSEAWISSTLTVVMNPFTRSFFRIGTGNFFEKIVDLILSGTLKLLILSGIATFDSDIADDVGGRGKVLMKEAQARGWYMGMMRMLGKSTDTYKIITPSGFEHIFSGLPLLGNDDNVLNGWIDDKALLKQRLSSQGIKVSKGGSFSKWKEAEAYFDSADKPLIVKPQLGSRGRHTTTQINTKEDFKQAFEVAKQLGYFVVVEEHLVGSVYRGTLIAGVFAGVLAGDPPRITGDGVHSIKDLIELKNKQRHARVGEVMFTDKLDIFLEKFSYTLDTILEAGKTIDLSEKIGLSYGGNAREVTTQVHPKLRLELERAAKIVSEPFLGFDFITTDASADPDTIKWGIIECNSVPFINLHHDPLEGEPINVAKMVLDYFERSIPLR